MEYRVEELAAAAGLRVDTVRFYQAKGLLPPPRRVKRVAIYSEHHLGALRRIRRYQSQGLSLTVIKRLLASGPGSKAEALLAAVADEAGEQAFTREQVAARSGVPEALLVSLEAAGLLRPMTGSGDDLRYGEADVQMARAGLEILGQGFPLDELLRLALRHARGVEEVTDAAIDLFARHVRKQGDLGKTDPIRLAESFRRLLPAVTTLVALHFQRTLLQRALSRLSDLPEREAFEAAIASAETGRLEVKWR
jgi:DNA-binding transcriptional MerR regulator